MKKVKDTLINLFVCFVSTALLLFAAGCTKDSNTDAAMQQPEQNAATLKVGLFFLNYSLDPKDYFNGWILVRIGAGETL